MKKTPIIAITITLIITASAAAQNPSYTIRKGDTLYGISKKFNIKIESLKSFNNIDDPSKLFPGMEIMIPGGYTVEKGDTLYSIAKAHDTTVGVLLNLNSMEPDAIIKQGQFLHVPASEVNAEDKEPHVASAESSGPEKSPAETEPADTEAPQAVGGSDDYWPHSGVRTVLTGKLQGIQIEGSPGDNVVSVAGGTVVWASEYGIYKKIVLVETRNGLVYGYGGNERTNVRVGDYVAPGSVIGILGGVPGTSSAYFFVYKNGKPVDPAKAPRV